MLQKNKNVRRMVAAVAGVAGAAAMCLASDCKLSVQASPRVLMPGQSAKVDIFASFPASGYAFASAEFDVISSHPAWTAVSSGAVLGDDVFGATASQAHLPQQGIFADPANPKRIWTGELKPVSYEPAMIDVRALPGPFSYYPSRLTSSSVPCDADGRSDLIFVNPLNVGQWLAAPGRNTRTTVADDVVVDGRIITAENYDSMSVGLLPRESNSGVVAPTRSSMRVEFDVAPREFSASAQVVQRSQVTSLTVTFDTTVSFSRGTNGLYVASADLPGSFYAFEGFRGGVSVATADLNGERGFEVARTPDVMDVIVSAGAGGGPHVKAFDGVNSSDLNMWRMNYGAAVPVRLPDGRIVTVDTIELRSRMRTPNNLKQIGLGAHVFEAAGAREMRVTPGQE